jgi:endonuclease YncB( thermonuclease family)
MQLEAFLRSRQGRRLVVASILVLVAWGLGRFERTPPSGGPVPSGDIEGVARLVDGDSFFLDGQEVRLKGIDAPEGRQTCRRAGQLWSCGEDSRRELQRLIAGARIVCHSIERDQHGRLLAYCRAGNRDLNRGMVASGMALSFGGYLKEETAARMARRGLWGSEFERPRDWRRQHGISR